MRTYRIRGVRYESGRTYTCTPGPGVIEVKANTLEEAIQLSGLNADVHICGLDYTAAEWASMGGTLETGSNFRDGLWSIGKSIGKK